jgi:hypothetical protein
LIYIDSGGHRMAARGLREGIREHRPSDIETSSIQDLLDSLDFIRKFAGIRFHPIPGCL